MPFIHEGSLSTGHANSVKDMLNRLETMVLNGTELPLEAVKKQISSAIHLVVHLARGTDHVRKITEITEITGCSDGEYELNPLFLREGLTLRWTGHPLKRDGKWKEVWHAEAPLSIAQ